MQVVCPTPALAMYCRSQRGWMGYTFHGTCLLVGYCHNTRRPCLCWGGLTGLCLGVDRQGSVLGWTDRALCWGGQTGLCLGVDRQVSVLGWTERSLCWGGQTGLCLEVDREVSVLGWTDRALS